MVHDAIYDDVDGVSDVSEVGGGWCSEAVPEGDRGGSVVGPAERGTAAEPGHVHGSGHDQGVYLPPVPPAGRHHGAAEHLQR